MIDDQKQPSESPRSAAIAGPSENATDRLISVEEAGRMLSRGRTFLRTLRLRGELVPVAIGGHRVAYYRSEVVHWLASRPRKLLAPTPAIKAIAAAYGRAGGENGGETS